jgi:hypothetical protein
MSNGRLPMTLAMQEGLNGGSRGREAEMATQVIARVPAARGRILVVGARAVGRPWPASATAPEPSRRRSPAWWTPPTWDPTTNGRSAATPGPAAEGGVRRIMR